MLHVLLPLHLSVAILPTFQSIFKTV